MTSHIESGSGSFEPSGEDVKQLFTICQQLLEMPIVNSTLTLDSFVFNLVKIIMSTLPLSKQTLSRKIPFDNSIEEIGEEFLTNYFTLPLNTFIQRYLNPLYTHLNYLERSKIFNLKFKLYCSLHYDIDLINLRKLTANNSTVSSHQRSMPKPTLTTDDISPDYDYDDCTGWGEELSVSRPSGSMPIDNILTNRMTYDISENDGKIEANVTRVAALSPTFSLYTVSRLKYAPDKMSSLFRFGRTGEYTPNQKQDAHWDENLLPDKNRKRKSSRRQQHDVEDISRSQLGAIPHPLTWLGICYKAKKDKITNHAVLDWERQELIYSTGEQTEHTIRSIRELLETKSSRPEHTAKATLSIGKCIFVDYMRFVDDSNAYVEEHLSTSDDIAFESIINRLSIVLSKMTYMTPEIFYR